MKRRLMEAGSGKREAGSVMTGLDGGTKMASMAFEIAGRPGEAVTAVP